MEGGKKQAGEDQRHFAGAKAPYVLSPSFTGLKAGASTGFGFSEARKSTGEAAGAACL